MEIEELLSSIGVEFGDQMAAELATQCHPRVQKSLKPVKRPQAAVGVVASPLGDLIVATSERGIVLTHYLRESEDAAAAIWALRREFDPIHDDAAVAKIGEEIRRYLAGDGDALQWEIDLTLAGNPFQKKVLNKLRAVPRGAVISYQALGAAAGVPNSARAVGNAMHNNPLAIYVPCHRVIAADGSLGGYAGGAARKLQLLRSEGFTIDSAKMRLPEGVVWGHKQTRIYCRQSCHAASRVDRTRILFFADSSRARQAGMRPCKLCRPA